MEKGSYDSGGIYLRFQGMIRYLPKNGAIRVEVETDEGELIASWWQKTMPEPVKPKPKTGKPSRYCLGPKYNQLGPKEKDRLSSLTPYLERDGRIKSRRRSKAARQDELFSRWGLNRSQGFTLLKSLTDCGALEERDGRYYITRDYLFRG